MYDIVCSCYDMAMRCKGSTIRERFFLPILVPLDPGNASSIQRYYPDLTMSSQVSLRVLIHFLESLPEPLRLWCACTPNDRFIHHPTCEWIRSTTSTYHCTYYLFSIIVDMRHALRRYNWPSAGCDFLLQFQVYNACIFFPEFPFPSHNYFRRKFSVLAPAIRRTTGIMNTNNPYVLFWPQIHLSNNCSSDVAQKFFKWYIFI